MKFTFFYLLSIALTVLSCSPQIKTSEEIKSSNTAQIIQGSVVTANDPIAAHIVLVHDLKKDYVCTGTLIGKNTVLTAAHCLSRKYNQFEVIFSRSGYKTMDARDMTKIRKVTKVAVHDDYEYDENIAPESNQADIGLVYFEGTLPAGYSIANVSTDASLLKKGQTVIMAGYGVSKLSYDEIKYKPSQRFKDKVKNGDVICNHNSYDADGDPFCIEISQENDGELRKTQTQIKYLSATEFILDEKKTGTCSGDSGGPVFIEKAGKLQLIGITSRGDLLCDSDGVYTAVPSYTDWILTH